MSCGTVLVVRSPSPDAADSLRKALERNLDWIKDHIPALASDSPSSARDIQAYIDWIYERLKDRIPSERPLMRSTAWSAAKCGRCFMADDLDSPASRALRTSNGSGNRRTNLRGILSAPWRRPMKCAPASSAFLTNLRQLVIEAYTLTEGELSSPGIRQRLAKNLGISRNAVDQRLSRALRSIRERMRKDPGSKTT